MKIALALLMLLVSASNVVAEVSVEDIWLFYFSKVQQPPPTTSGAEGEEGSASPSAGQQQKQPSASIAGNCPGRVIGQASDEMHSAFTENWPFRSASYELYFTEKEQLAKTVYSLALFTGDIDSSILLEKFVKGVQGYRYSVGQVCDWLNSFFFKSDVASLAPSPDELSLVGYLLQDRIIRLEGKRFVSTGEVRHILAASSGKKRSFDLNLRHERLHVIWEESKTFCQNSLDQWSRISDEEKKGIRKTLHVYSDKNETDIVKEWAVRNAEQTPTSIYESL